MPLRSLFGAIGDAAKEGRLRLCGRFTYHLTCEQIVTQHRLTLDWPHGICKHATTSVQQRALMSSPNATASAGGGSIFGIKRPFAAAFTFSA